MFMNKVKAATALLVITLGGAADLASRAPAARAGDPKADPPKSAAKDADKPKGDTDAERIQGTWVVVSAEEGGKEAPADAIKNFTIVVTADKFVFKPNGEAREAAYKLDPTKTPKEVELTPLDGPAKGKALKNIYQLDGDDLKLCVQNGQGGPPTEFATKSDSGLRLLVLKRQPEAKDKPEK